MSTYDRAALDAVIDQWLAEGGDESSAESVAGLLRDVTARAAHEHALGESNRLLRERDEALAQVRALREALAEYGEHRYDCRATNVNGADCDCGLAAALSAPAPKPQPAPAECAEFLSAFDAWATSEELCGGPLFDAMMGAWDAMQRWDERAAALAQPAPAAGPGPCPTCGRRARPDDHGRDVTAAHPHLRDLGPAPPLFGTDPPADEE